MKILTVTYRTNRPTVGSRYVHEHVEATAQVGKHETPEVALQHLKAQVHAMLYPELVGLRERVAAVSSMAGHYLATFTDEALAQAYAENTEEFTQLLKGDLAPRDFVSTFCQADERI